MELSVETVEIKETVVKKVSDFVLHLTEDEAKDLLAVLGALAPCNDYAKGPGVTSIVYTLLGDEFEARGYSFSMRRKIHLDGIKPRWAKDADCCS